MSSQDRLHALDAVRASALLLGVVFHAGFSFIPGLIPGIWAAVDVSPSSTISVLLFTSHMFRMSLFFFIAGFFARMMYHRKGARGFWKDRLRRILIPLVAGWVVLFPAIAAVWIWGFSRSGLTSMPAPPPSAPPPPPAAFPLTHLWFLYYLLILYVVVLAGRAVIVAVDRSGIVRRTSDALVRGAIQSGGAAVLLAIPVTLALYTRDWWFAWFGIPTPDQSLLPQWASLIPYGMAVAFGWLVNRQFDVVSVWARQWPLHIGGALTATLVCLSLAGTTPSPTPAVPGMKTLAYAGSYATGIWCWSLGLIGLAARFFSHPNATVRYVADASYWIYLVHLPIVAALQVVVAGLAWHWAVKFPVVVGGSLVVLLASYRYLVRSTFIGQLLNGRRHPRVRADRDGGKVSDNVAAPSTEASCTSSRSPNSASTTSSA